MYFLLCCFTVTQCQLSLFNGGYLKAGGTKRVHIAALFIPASWIGWKKNLVKRNASQWTQKKCTMLTVFQIPLIGFFTMRRKPPLFLSSTSTNNALTKPPNPAFCSWTKPPRLSKRSHWRTKKKKKKDKKTPLFTIPPPPFLFPAREKKRMGGGGGIVSELMISVFLKEEGWPLRCTGLREKERGEINKVWLALSLPPLGCEHKKDTDPSGGPVAGTSLSPSVRRRRGAAEPRSDWLARGSLSAQGRWSNLLSIFCAPRLGYAEAGRRERSMLFRSTFFGGWGGEEEEEIVKWSDNGSQPHCSLEAIPRTAASPSSGSYGCNRTIPPVCSKPEGNTTLLAPRVWGLFKAVRQPRDYLRNVVAFLNLKEERKGRRAKRREGRKEGEERRGERDRDG